MGHRASRFAPHHGVSDITVGQHGETRLLGSTEVMYCTIVSFVVWDYLVANSKVKLRAYAHYHTVPRHQDPGEILHAGTHTYGGDR